VIEDTHAEPDPAIRTAVLPILIDIDGVVLEMHHLGTSDLVKRRQSLLDKMWPMLLQPVDPFFFATLELLSSLEMELPVLLGGLQRPLAAAEPLPGLPLLRRGLLLLPRIQHGEGLLWRQLLCRRMEIRLIVLTAVSVSGSDGTSSTTGPSEPPSPLPIVSRDSATGAAIGFSLMAAATSSLLLPTSLSSKDVSASQASSVYDPTDRKHNKQ